MDVAMVLRMVVRVLWMASRWMLLGCSDSELLLGGF